MNDIVAEQPTLDGSSGRQLIRDGEQLVWRDQPAARLRLACGLFQAVLDGQRSIIVSGHQPSVGPLVIEEYDVRRDRVSGRELQTRIVSVSVLPRGESALWLDQSLTPSS